jgi:hypothetical protein
MAWAASPRSGGARGDRLGALARLRGRQLRVLGEREHLVFVRVDRAIDPSDR